MDLCRTAFVFVYYAHLAQYPASLLIRAGNIVEIKRAFSAGVTDSEAPSYLMQSTVYTQ